MQLMMVATLEGFGLQWPMGDDQLMVCSVGTGSFDPTAPLKSLKKYTQLHWLALLLMQMMRDAAELNQTMLQWLSQSPTGQVIDSQIGNLENDQLGAKPLIHYVRYNVELEAEALQELGADYTKKQAEALRAMSDTSKIPALDELGQLAAKQQVQPEHFPACFDRTTR